MLKQASRTTRPAERPELQSGDRLTRAEFHRLYEQMPEDFKAELIGGIVYVASPLRIPHSSSHLSLGAVVAGYAGYTPGVQGNDNANILLGEGLATTEHHAFVQKLASQYCPAKKGRQRRKK